MSKLIFTLLFSVLIFAQSQAQINRSIQVNTNKLIATDVAGTDEMDKTNVDSVFFINYRMLESGLKGAPNNERRQFITFVPAARVDTRNGLLDASGNTRKATGVIFRPFISEDSVLYSTPLRYKVNRVRAGVHHLNKTKQPDTLRYNIMRVLELYDINNDSYYYEPDTTPSGLYKSVDKFITTSISSGTSYQDLSTTPNQLKQILQTVDVVIEDSSSMGFAVMLEFFAPTVEKFINNQPVLVSDTLGVQNGFFLAWKPGYFNRDSVYTSGSFNDGIRDSIQIARYPNSFSWLNAGQEYLGWEGNVFTLSAPDFSGQRYSVYNNIDAEVDVRYIAAPVDTTTSVGKTVLAPAAIGKISPNPSVKGNDQVVVPFQLINPEPVKIEVFNTVGQVVKTIEYEQVNGGKHEIRFTVEGLNNGLYFCKVSTGTATSTQRLVVAK